MKIDASQAFPEGAGLQRVGTTGASASQYQEGRVGLSSDEVQLSADGETIQQMKASLDRLPDVRQGRVAPLQQTINEGTYQVSGQQIAQAMSADLVGEG
jgi:negative regulator of flagellin synthesis FlgM